MTNTVSLSRWSAAADAYDAWFDRPWGFTAMLEGDPQATSNDDEAEEP